MICTFSEPKSIGTGGIEQVAKVSDNFAYKKMTCDNPEGATGIGTNYTTITSPAGLRYELSNSFTYGDLINAGLLSMLLLVFLFWGVYLLTFRRKY